MDEESRMLSGKLYNPGDNSLKFTKLRTHNLCTQYNKLFENEKTKRDRLLYNIFHCVGECSFFQGPIFIHYGKHNKIGDRFFVNFNFTVQDDAHVTIGNDCNFGPNVTIVTPTHPLIGEERLGINIPDLKEKKYCYAKPVIIGNNCWVGSNVTICP